MNMAVWWSVIGINYFHQGSQNNATFTDWSIIGGVFRLLTEAYCTPAVVPLMQSYSAQSLIYCLKVIRTEWAYNRCAPDWESRRSETTHWLIISSASLLTKCSVRCHGFIDSCDKEQVKGCRVWVERKMACTNAMITDHHYDDVDVVLFLPTFTMSFFCWPREKRGARLRTWTVMKTHVSAHMQIQCHDMPPLCLHVMSACDFLQFSDRKIEKEKNIGMSISDQSNCCQACPCMWTSGLFFSIDWSLLPLGLILSSSHVKHVLLSLPYLFSLLVDRLSLFQAGVFFCRSIKKITNSGIRNCQSLTDSFSSAFTSNGQFWSECQAGVYDFSIDRFAPLFMPTTLFILHPASFSIWYLTRSFPSPLTIISFRSQALKVNITPGQSDRRLKSAMRSHLISSPFSRPFPTPSTDPCGRL